MIRFACTNCHTMLELPDEYAGRSGRCSNCGSVVQAPQPVVAAAVAGNGESGARGGRARGGRFARWRGAAKKRSVERQRRKYTPLTALLAWLDNLPRTHPSFRELEERRAKPLFLSADDLARSKAYFDVPLLTALKQEALVIVKTTAENVAPGTAQAVSSGKVDFVSRHFAAPEYPVVQLLFVVNDNPERPLKFESLPLITDGNALEFFATALRHRRISFALYSGSQNNHVATTDFTLTEDAMCDLGNTLVQAFRQWARTRPAPEDHDPAVKRFTREIPL